MKKLALLILLCLPVLGSVSVNAQESYDQGSFWAVTGVDTKDGMFDAYIEDLDSLWHKQMVMLKEAGKVKSYMMMANVHPRQGEPDLWLFVEWTSAGAMLDTPAEEWREMTAKLTGSLDKSRELSMARGELRTIMSDLLLREISFRE